MDIDPDLITDERGFTIGSSEPSVGEFEEWHGSAHSPEDDQLVVIAESEFIGV